MINSILPANPQRTASEAPLSFLFLWSPPPSTVSVCSAFSSRTCKLWREWAIRGKRFRRGGGGRGGGSTWFQVHIAGWSMVKPSRNELIAWDASTSPWCSDTLCGRTWFSGQGHGTWRFRRHCCSTRRGRGSSSHARCRRWGDCLVPHWGRGIHEISCMFSRTC